MKHNFQTKHFAPNQVRPDNPHSSVSAAAVEIAHWAEVTGRWNRETAVAFVSRAMEGKMEKFEVDQWWDNMNHAKDQDQSR